MGESSGTSERKFNNLQLRTIALVAMVALNVAWCGLIKNPYIQVPLGIIGSGSITLFAFLADEACRNTKNYTKYLVRLLVLAVISAVPYFFVYTYGKEITSLLDPKLYFSSPMTIFLCAGSVMMLDKLKSQQLKTFAIVFLCILSFILGFEWCPYALVIMFILHMYREKRQYRDFYITMFFITFAVVNAAMYFMGFFKGHGTEIMQNVSLIGCVWPVFLIRKYDGKLGKSVKILSYSAYPLLLLSIFLLKLLLDSKG